MKSLLIQLICLLCFINTSFAQDDVKKAEFILDDLEQMQIPAKDPADTEGNDIQAKQIWVDKDSAVPWDGLLFNPDAAAVVLAEHYNLQQRAELALNMQRKSDLLKLNLETGKLKLDLDALKKETDLKIKGRDEEIKSCQIINKKIVDDRSHIKKKIFLGLGTGLAGLVVGFLVGVFAH